VSTAIDHPSPTTLITAMNPHETKPKSDDEKSGAKTREERGVTDPKLVKLDFAKLDLTIEKVDERISPSETNVFDK
jgi:hypothetical protein